MCGVDGQGGPEGRAVKACAVALRFAFYGAQPNARSLQIGAHRLDGVAALAQRLSDERGGPRDEVGPDALRDALPGGGGQQALPAGAQLRTRTASAT